VETKNKDAASRRLLLMSFLRHEEIYPNHHKRADQNAGALLIVWMSFQLAIP
jgi:hypothetical protein